MTHDELLAKIKPKDIPDLNESAMWLNALLAVVKLHKPMELKKHRCNNCLEIYPCPTIRAIEKVLNAGI